MTTTNGQKDTTTSERFAAKAHDTVDEISDRAQRAERQVRGAAERTVERARELHGQYADTAEESLRRATSYVESHQNEYASYCPWGARVVARMQR